MKSLLHKPLLFFSKPLGLFFASLMALLLLAGGCQTTDSNKKNEEADAVFTTIVYGKVDSLNPAYMDNKSVLFIPHKYSCSDSTGASDAITHYLTGTPILQSGKYRLIFNFPPKRPAGEPHCYEAFVVSYDISKKPSPLEYDSLLAGPKKLGDHFNSHFLIKPPFDSVRIDFTVHDSTKIKR